MQSRASWSMVEKISPLDIDVDEAQDEAATSEVVRGFLLALNGWAKIDQKNVSAGPTPSPPNVPPTYFRFRNPSRYRSLGLHGPYSAEEYSDSLHVWIRAWD